MGRLLAVAFEFSNFLKLANHSKSIHLARRPRPKKTQMKVLFAWWPTRSVQKKILPEKFLIK